MAHRFEDEGPGEGSDGEASLLLNGSQDTDDDEMLLLGNGTLKNRGGQLVIQGFEELGEARNLNKLSNRQILLLNTGFFGLNFVLVAWNLLLLPSQTRSVDTDGQDRKGEALSLVVAAGSVVTVFLGPLLGVASDRSMSRFGRRKFFLVFGVALLCIFQFGLYWAAPNIPPDDDHTPADCDKAASLSTTVTTRAPTPLSSSTTTPLASTSSTTTTTAADDAAPLQGHLWLLAVMYACSMLAFQAINIPYQGLVADNCPPGQRGRNSGAMGIMSILGNVFGASLGLLYHTIGVSGMYLACGLSVALSTAVVVFAVHERPPRSLRGRQPLRPIATCRSLISPLYDHDFRWVFLTRFLMQMGLATVFYYLQYFLQDAVELPSGMGPEEAVSALILPLLVAAAPATVVCGYLSDVFHGRRKMFILLASVMMAAVTGVMTMLRNFYSLVFFMFLFGIGYGTYLSVDFAMVLDVLVKDKDYAKDLSVWHQALVLPQLLATPVGGFVRDTFQTIGCKDHHCDRCAVGYVMLFVLTSVYFVLSGMFVVRIKKIL